MPSLISQLLPISKDNNFNSLLKLSNDQLLSLIQSYSLSNHSPKLIVKNNRLEAIKIEDKVYKISNLRESNIDLYGSLAPGTINSDTHQDDQQDGNRCVSLGSLNYRANILNFKPSSNPASSIVTDESAIRTNHLKIDVLEYISSKLDLDSPLEVDLDSLRRHFHKVPLTQIKAVYDEITIPKSKKLNAEQLLLIKNLVPNRQLEKYLTSLGYAETDPLRLMISNNTSLLELKSKQYQDTSRSHESIPPTQASKPKVIQEKSESNISHSSSSSASSTSTRLNEVKHKTEVRHEIVVPLVKKPMKKKPLTSSPAAYPQLKPIKHTRKLSSGAPSTGSTPELKPIAPQSSKKSTTSPKKAISSNNVSRLSSSTVTSNNKSISISETNGNRINSALLPKTDNPSNSPAITPELKPISRKPRASSLSTPRPTLIDTSNLRKLSKTSKNSSPIKKRPTSHEPGYETAWSASNSGSDEDVNTATTNGKRLDENILTSPRKKRRTVSEVSSTSTSSASSVSSGGGKKGSPLTSYSEDEDEVMKPIGNKSVNHISLAHPKPLNHTTPPITETTTAKKPLPTQPRLASPNISSIPKSPKLSLSNNTSKVSSPKSATNNVSSPKGSINIPKGPINLPKGPKAMGGPSSSSSTPTPTTTTSMQLKSPRDSSNSGNSTPRTNNLNHAAYTHNNENRQHQQSQLTQSDMIDLSLRYHNLYKEYSELYNKIEIGWVGSNDENGELSRFVKLSNELSWIRWRLESFKG